MSDDCVINFKVDTLGEHEKRIMLPFIGFYDSEYVNRIHENVDSLANEHELSDDQVEHIISKINYNAHFKVIAAAYVDYLNKELSDILPKPINMTQPDIHAITLLAVMADNVSAVINVNELPSVGFMSDFCEKHKLLDFKKNLQVVADDKLLSKYQDITSLFDTPYKNWQNVHIECLMSTLVQVLQVNKTGKEKVNWLHDIVDFEASGFIPYADEKNLLDIKVNVELN